MPNINSKNLLVDPQVERFVFLHIRIWFVSIITIRRIRPAYVSVMVLPTIINTELKSPDIRYHLTERDINGACTGFP